LPFCFVAQTDIVFDDIGTEEFIDVKSMISLLKKIILFDDKFIQMALYKLIFKIAAYVSLHSSFGNIRDVDAVSVFAGISLTNCISVVEVFL